MERTENKTKDWKLVQLRKALRNSKNNLFQTLFQDYGKINLSATSSRVSPATIQNLGMIQLKRIPGELDIKSKKKKILWWKSAFSKANLPLENKVISSEQPMLQAVYFALLFNYLIVFTPAIWEREIPKSP